MRKPSLMETHPQLVKEWSPRNMLSPDSVSAGSKRKVWWICGKGHEWSAIVYNRTKGKNCPYCTGQKVCEDNCLNTTNPALATQWHPTRNGDLTANNVTRGSGKRAWWLCECGHEWPAVIAQRNRGKGCPHCRRESKGCSCSFGKGGL